MWDFIFCIFLEGQKMDHLHALCHTPAVIPARASRRGCHSEHALDALRRMGDTIALGRGGSLRCIFHCKVEALTGMLAKTDAGTA